MEGKKEASDKHDIMVNVLNIAIYLEDRQTLNKILSQIDNSSEFSRELLFNVSLGFLILGDKEKAQIYLEKFRQDILSKESNVEDI